MSDSYNIDGVTVTPKGGGFYDLTHTSLAEAETVRGKEVADARAKAIAVAAQVPEGHIPPQPPLPDTPPAVDPAAAPPAHPDAVKPPAAAPLPNTDDGSASPPLPHSPPAPPEPAPPAEPEAPPVATVTVSEGEAPPVPGRVPVGIPREFTGTIDKKTQKALGVPMTRIILDDNPDIPPTGLFVQHNFRPYMIVTGVEVDVPDFLLGVLNDAVISLPVVDPKSQKVLGYRDRMKYPYRKV